MARAAKVEKRSEAQGDGSKVIRRQIQWMAGFALVIALVAMVVYWGQDTGWGNADRAVASKLKKGDESFVAGRLDLAVAQYEAVATRYPEHAQATQALTQWATALQQEGKLSESLTVLQRLAQKLEPMKEKSDLQAYTLLQVAKVKKDMADYSGAMSAYGEVRQKHPKTDWSGEAQSGLGAVLQAQRRYKEAREAYGVLIKEMPGGFLAAEAQTAVGECYEAEGDLKNAAKAYQTVMEKYPSAVWDNAKSRLDALKKTSDAAKTAAKKG